MTKINIRNYFMISMLILSASVIAQNHAFGDSSGNFAILSSTYTNTLPGTSIVGDLGYITGPAMAPAVNGIIHTSDSVYSQAGTAQSAATSYANSKACTTNLGTTVDLSQVHGGVYTPGVYCTTGAASIGAGGITLSGNGIFIFKIQGALTTVSGSAVHLNGAQASNVFWVPIAATTLGANTHFAGIILDAAGITISHNVNMVGRALAFGGTVSTDGDTIAVPSFTMADKISGNFQCTFTFPPGAIDLGSNVQFGSKVYPPGVYCIDGALNIGSGPITLTGNGAHIFKINGAFNQAANTDVILSNGALVSGVIWMPVGATTIGANSHLIGTVNGAPITIGANSAINGMSPAKVMADAIPNSYQCTFTFPPGAIDLGSNVQFGSKVYPPGVYCIDGALNIGSGPITLTGNGAHIFKINGAFGQVANSDVILSHGAQASSVIWIPVGATTIGANSHLIGTVDGAPITIGANSDINGVGPAMIMADAISDNYQCTVAFPHGAIDLGSNIQYPTKIYPPGVYCIDGALNIGSGPITLTGNGAHIFKINGAFGQVANSDVILANGALVSGVIWVPTGATTIGANSHLIGTVDGAPITIGANSDINGVGPKIMADAISGNFAILSSTYTNTLPGTSIVGDLGYTTGPAMAPAISGIIHVADAAYQQAGTAQSSATSYANSKACTVNLGTTVNLSLVHGGVYKPGVYCTTGAASIGARGITLSGNGIYIFKTDGALTTVANSAVTLSNGAQASNVFWVPTAATTLGANTRFAGTILDAAGVTINHNVSMTGRVLTFGGTVSTDGDTITVPSFTMADAVPSDFQCTFTFPPGAIDLGSNVQFGDKVYPPGVYCIDGALNIGSGPITLTGNGAHIFKINGAFGQAANTDVILANGAQASSVIWIPVGATTIGANSHLIGTVNGAPITIGANSDINGVGPAKIMADAIHGNFVSLGSAGSFAVLGSTTVTNTGNTLLTGNLGISPGSSVTGFPPGMVIGAKHVTDSSAAQARNDATNAYNSLSSATCTTNEPTIADIGGQTLKPGVYCFPSSAFITGTLTLSGNGVYIFKMGSTLITAAGPGASNIALTNGASASNVFWQVGSSATLGTYSNFKGTIIALTSITSTTGATVDGRLLALNGAVTLDDNKIIVSSQPFGKTLQLCTTGAVVVNGHCVAKGKIVETLQ